MNRDVVITGLGVVSPIGIGIDAFWTSLMDGTSGIELFPEYEGMPANMGGRLKEFEPKKYVKPRKSLKVMCRELQTAFSASAMAAEQAGLEATQVDPDRIGTVFGSEMMYGEVTEFVDLYRNCRVDGKFAPDKYAEQFPNQIYPLWMLKNLPNMAACHVGIAQDARGPNNTIVSGDVSSLLALQEAMRVIDRGSADVMFVGGTGTRIGLTPWMYRGSLNLSKRIDQPQSACRPFDATRDGTVNAEGAGAIVIETAEHAQARGAKVLAHIDGFATAMATGAENAGRQAIMQRTIEMALANSSVDRIGHVNAHALGTVDDDRLEAQAIHAALGDVPVTALKSYFGHLGSGTSIVELIGSVIAINEGRVPHTLNFTTPDPDCPVNVVRNKSLAVAHPSALKLGYSDTGQTAAVILKRS